MENLFCFYAPHEQYYFLCFQRCEFAYVLKHYLMFTPRLEILILVSPDS